MKDLSITQEYMMCTVNGKGTISSYNQKAVACLVVSGLLEMELAKCISINDKKVSICTELPEGMTYHWRISQTDKYAIQHIEILYRRRNATL